MRDGKLVGVKEYVGHEWWAARRRDGHLVVVGQQRTERGQPCEAREGRSPEEARARVTLSPGIHDRAKQQVEAKHGPG